MPYAAAARRQKSEIHSESAKYNNNTMHAQTLIKKCNYIKVAGKVS